MAEMLQLPQSRGPCFANHFSKLSRHMAAHRAVNDSRKKIQQSLDQLARLNYRLNLFQNYICYNYGLN
eukprot:273358-Amphidinium_carterae.1